MTDKTGRPTMTLRVHGPDRDIDFVGNIWEVLAQMANAERFGLSTEILKDDVVSEAVEEI